MPRAWGCLVMLSVAGLVSGQTSAEAQTCLLCHHDGGIWYCQETGFSNWGYMSCQPISGGCGPPPRTSVAEVSHPRRPGHSQIA